MLTSDGFGQTFTFEDAVATRSLDSAPVGALTSLTATSGGISLTLRREGNAPFDVTDGTGRFPASFGTRSIDPMIDTVNKQCLFIGTFSEPVSSVRVEFGDLGGDSDRVVLFAKSVTSLTIPSGTSFAAEPFALTVYAAGITSFSFYTESPIASEWATSFNSVWLDNVAVNVPEPIAASSGFLAAALLCRRPRRDA